MIVYAADDEKLALVLLSNAIGKAIPDAQVFSFRKSSDLLEKVKETRPDIVFLDVEMPGLTGLELAKELNKIEKDLNIIFVTGYREYAVDAFEVCASGYITKPCKPEDITAALSHLRYPICKNYINIHTFGNFDIFYKNKPVAFRSAKSKEMLAYLVDRNGSLVSRQEMAGILFEDEDFSRNVQSRLSQFAERLLQDLKSAGIENFFFTDGGYYIDLSKADCDLVDFINGKAKSSFTGEYMEQYSWAELRKADFK